MSMSIRPTILCASFLLSTFGTLAFTSSCTQPPVNCAAAYGYYATEYTLTDGDPNSVCGQLLGDVLGMETYYQEGGKNGTPDYTNADVAIRPESLGIMIDYAEIQGAIDGDEVFYHGNAIGSFTTGFPNKDAICMADDFEASEVSLPDVDGIMDDPNTEEDETHDPQPAIDVKYQWRNVSFLVSADAQGTQFEADLEYTQDGCTATYHVVGVYPAVYCETDDECDDDENGINPSFAVRCNTDLGLCVLAKDIPSYE